MTTKFAGLLTIFLLALTFGCGGPQPGRADVEPGPMPEGGNFDGVFQSPAWGRLEITVNGDSALGLFESDSRHGRIEGKIEGDLMTYTWTGVNTKVGGKTSTTVGKGYFRYIIEEEGTTKKRKVHWIKGEWGYDENNAGNVWDAVRLSRAKKKLQPRDDTGPTAVMDDDYAASAGFGVNEAPADTEETSVEMSEPEKKKEEKPEEDDSMDGLF